MTRWRIVLARLPILTLLAITLGILAGMSSLVRLLPFPWTPTWTFIFTGVILLSLAPALLSTRTPIPATIGIIVLVLAAAAYDQSRLDWLRTLKDFGVADPDAPPNYARLALALLALLLTWALHVVDVATRLRAAAITRGVPSAQARNAARITVTRSMTLAVQATLGTILIGGIAHLATRLDAEMLYGGRAAILAPLLAIALIALAAILLTRRDGASDAPE